MTQAVFLHGIRVVLLDIEGTTTRIAFVHDVLFPYARARLGAFLSRTANRPATSAALALLREEHATDAAAGASPPPLEPAGPPGSLPAAVAYLEWLMDRDRKSPALKALQGLIWEEGYQAGELRGEVFPDVAPAIRRWREAGCDVAVYSSGSELAQRRLFESTPDGNLAALMAGFFDTSVGAKTDASSYRRIAEALRHATDEILFLSDVTRELAAAREAGCRTALVVRPGNAPQPDAGAYPVVRSFEDLP